VGGIRLISKFMVAVEGDGGRLNVLRWAVIFDNAGSQLRPYSTHCLS
jgi:hypothetical protein